MRRASLRLSTAVLAAGFLGASSVAAGARSKQAGSRPPSRAIPVARWWMSRNRWRRRRSSGRLPTRGFRPRSSRQRPSNGSGKAAGAGMM